MFKLVHVFLLCAAALTSSLIAAESKDEGVEFVALDNGFKVWTKRVGDGPIKILTLHGGPGCTHEYFECFEDYFPKDQYQIIYYDQLDSYYSDKTDDPSLWTVDRFCEEVEQVRKQLGLNQFYLYGQSWGGFLAIEYSLKYQQHLKGVIISNMTASVESYEAYANELKLRLPLIIQERLKFYEDAEDYFNPEYENVMFNEVYSQYLCHLNPWPEPVMRTMEHQNEKIYQVMQGPNEFVIIGNMKHWDRWNDLPKITVPALVIGGRYDTMNPADLEKMARLMPNGQVKICENGSHLSLYDDQETYFEALHAFLNHVERQD